MWTGAIRRIDRRDILRMIVLGVLTSCAQPAAANSYDPDPNTLRDLRADARDEADLAAQQSMATWAAWMTALTAVTTVGTGISIFFIYRSFQQTGRALAEAQTTNFIAQKTSFIENRPWIMIEGPRFEVFYDEITEDSLRVEIRGRFRIKNIGRLPAQKVGYDIVLTQESYEVARAMATNSSTTWRGGAIIVPAGIDYDFTVAKHYLTVNAKMGKDPDLRLIQILIKVGYFDPNHGEMLLTVGHGVVAESDRSNPESFSPIVADKVRLEGPATTGVYAYTLMHMS